MTLLLAERTALGAATGACQALASASTLTQTASCSSLHMLKQASATLLSDLGATTATTPGGSRSTPKPGDDETRDARRGTRDAGTYFKATAYWPNMAK